MGPGLSFRDGCFESERMILEQYDIGTQIFNLVMILKLSVHLKLYLYSGWKRDIVVVKGKLFCSNDYFTSKSINNNKNCFQTTVLMSLSLDRLALIELMQHR